jgi:hypothetical protein
MRPSSPVDFTADAALRQRGAQALARSIELLQSIAADEEPQAVTAV